MITIFWLVAFVIFTGIEVATLALTTVWFAGGAFVAFLVSLTGVPVEAQLAVFLIVSFLLLFLTRPFAAKYINSSTERTNADSLIGAYAKVTARISNEQGTGAAVVNGQEWTARAKENQAVFEPGDKVIIEEIRGVKLIVSAVEKKPEE
ncbi:MAG: NfeD family protein [Clostridiales bacterium]|nr:NfeD family protein [Clostridiales bacterium]